MQLLSTSNDADFNISIYVTFLFKVVFKTQLLLFLQEYSIQITFRQQWNDHRLKFDSREGK